MTVTADSAALLSTSRTEVGSKSITFTDVTDTSNRTFYVQGLEQGTTTMTAAAAGYADQISNLSVTPSGFDLSSSGSAGWGDFSITTLSANRTMSVHAYRLNTNGTISNLSAGRQELRAGHDPVEILVTSSDTAVGTITASPLTFTAAGGLSRNTAFNPLTAGSTDITIGHPEGFTVPTNGRTTITATVTE